VAPPPKNQQPMSAVRDAVHGNWVDDRAPEALRPYLRLARADRPIGTWLLMFPCWWSLVLAQINEGQTFPNLWSLAVFAIGAWVMRGAGCTWNDIVDRDYDKQVARTASRPIPSGQVSVRSAVVFAIVLSLVGLAVLLSFNTFTIALAIASLGLVGLYPFMKRITYWPQVVLGLAFNWGALVGWASVTSSLSLAPFILYAGAVAWTIGYDTIYAHQDREDDLMVGLKSTALRFGDRTKTWVTLFYLVALGCWLFAALEVGAGWPSLLALSTIAAHFVWQIRSLNINDDANCLARFRANRDVGAILFLGLVADLLVQGL
jgi:4-hydroxybenzoate polyprenyltransferase